MIFAARKSRDAAGATRRDLGNRLQGATASVRGVSDVENQMTTHASAAHVPSLQGVSERPAHWGAWLHSGWSPTAMVAGCAAIAAAVVGFAALRPATR
jgi:hypothetical protein